MALCGQGPITISNPAPLSEPARFPWLDPRLDKSLFPSKGSCLGYGWLAHFHHINDHCRPHPRASIKVLLRSPMPF